MFLVYKSEDAHWSSFTYQVVLLVGCLGSVLREANREISFFLLATVPLAFSMSLILLVLSLSISL